MDRTKMPFASRLIKSLAIALPLAFVANSSSAFSLEGTIWETKQKKVDPYLLYSVALKESRRLNPDNKTSMRPWPWAVNYAGKGSYFSSKEEAKEYIQDLINQGAKSIDIGFMQINTFWQKHRFESPFDLLEPEKAISVSADILYEAMLSSPEDIEVGIGRYHQWESVELARSYGRDVLNYREALMRIKEDSQ